ncbi:hypothetical protein [Massilia sp. UYP11]|uniref:hypothetical protein n=1 Tax=Massilia sp. UYP11 TaxID=1756385 RepID=UPI003D20073F
MTELDRKLQAGAWLARRVEGDRLVLADAVLAQALDGSRPLTAGERAALQASPLTLRRLRHLAQSRRAQVQASRGGWRGSEGLLRAADSGDGLDLLRTDDGMWRLHFVDAAGRLAVVVQLDPEAPDAAGIMAARPAIQVRDGSGALVLEGQLDADGECEGPWPFAVAPAAHFQQHGARFEVIPRATPIT